MGVFSRIPDIVNSNLNAILDKAENPAKMVRLIIVEMESTLVEVRSQAARMIADKKELARKAAHEKRQSTTWQSKAELALNKGREDLAKAALAERNRSQEASEAFEAELKTVEESLERLQEDITALSAKLKDAKSREASLVVRNKTARSRVGIRKQLGQHNVDEALIRFEQYERKINDLEGTIESYDIEKRSLADEIDELDDTLDADLQALKAQLADKRKPAASDKDKTESA